MLQQLSRCKLSSCLSHDHNSSALQQNFTHASIHFICLSHKGRTNTGRCDSQGTIIRVRVVYIFAARSTYHSEYLTLYTRINSSNRSRVANTSCVSLSSVSIYILCHYLIQAWGLLLEEIRYSPASANIQYVLNTLRWDVY